MNNNNAPSHPDRPPSFPPDTSSTDLARGDEELARAFQAAEWNVASKPGRLVFKHPERFGQFPGLIVTANNNQCPNPEEFFQLKYKDDKSLDDLEKSFHCEQRQLHIKYLKLLLPQLPANKLASHIAALCEMGALDKEGIIKFFDILP